MVTAIPKLTHLMVCPVLCRQVSYMVAIKRINVLLSTLVGCVMFNERIGRRMPYILLMLLGMLLIVLQPGHEALHHSHHTH